MEELHFSQLIMAQAKKFGDKTALFSRNKLSDKWTKLTWNDFSNEVIFVAKAFLEVGINEKQCVGQFSQNKAESLVVDFALYANRAILVPMYATSSISQVEFIVNDAEIELLFVGDQQQYNVAVEVMKLTKVLKKIIVFDNDVVLNEKVNSVYYEDFKYLGKKSTKHYELEQRQDEASEDDLACILYTSGTTGNPKGVMLPHSCFLQAMTTHKSRLTSITSNDISIAFLPLSHVFERTWCYFCLNVGVTIYINLKPIEIQQTIKDVRPTLMCAVPRFWEKVYAGVQENIAKMSPLMIGIVAWAVATGKKYNLDYLRIGKKPGILLKMKYLIADKLIFSKVKQTIGIENANMLPTAGAKLSDEITTFMRSIGVPIVYGYGLTESTATVSCFTYEGYEIGTVGTLMPNISIKLGEDNEILLKGKTIFPGYYKNDEANKASFTEDGWFRTGDAGILKGDKIILTDRIKDLFKTSNGKYIAPQSIETLLVLDKYIEQVAVIGDERNYVTAIIAPSITAIEEYAHKNKIPYENTDELIDRSEIHALIEKRIKELQSSMANYEQIKRFTLINKAFTIETGELTNTLKVRRTVIMQKYKSQIEAMYAS